MDCSHCIDALHAYVDEELPPDEMEEVRRHLATCPSCAAEHARVRDTSRILRATLERHAAPDVLRARIRAAVAAEGRAPAPAPIAVPRAARRTTTWGRAAAAVALAAVLGSAVTNVVERRDDGARRTADEVMASHIRSLMPGHLVDIASNNQHNVKPWFNGRVNLSPPVPRLDSLGFPLIGGRLDYVGGQPVAVVVYMRAQHVINVFWRAAPADGEARMPSASIDNGYRTLRGSRDGLEYWIVSDLNGAELEQFRRLLLDR